MADNRINASYSEAQGLLTLEISGVFNYDHISEFREAYEGTPVPAEQVVVDLHGVEAIDSAALGMLLNMQSKLGLDRDTVRIVNAPAEVRRILDIVHFDKKFTIE